MPRAQRLPTIVVEFLRLCVVVFFAGLGSRLGALLKTRNASDLLGVDPLVLGIALGSALGYVLGGVLGRGTISAVGRTESALRGVDAEHIVAGGLGAALGALAGAALTWPVLLVASAALTLPVLGFATVALGLLGYRLGAVRRDAVLALLGPRAGMAPRNPARASLPRVLDTSVAIDGRIVDVVRAGFLHGRMLVPMPVVEELQALADAGDDLRRARGRRGLEVLEALRREEGVSVEVTDDAVVAVPEVDAKLVRTCLDHGYALLTLDTNLARAAGLAGVRVLNMHALGLALRPPVVAGDEVAVLLLKAGREPGQAVGYLDDGTMVVVERARERVGTEAQVTVTSVLTTANGRMVFGRLAPAAAPAPAPARHPDPAAGGIPVPTPPRTALRAVQGDA